MPRNEAVGPGCEERSGEVVALVGERREDRSALVQEREEARQRRGQNEEKGGAARAHGMPTLAEYNCRLRGDQAPRRFPLVGR